jgi:hypothetical protein
MLPETIYGKRRPFVIPRRVFRGGINLTKTTEGIVAKEIRHLRRSLHTLDHSLRRLAPMLSTAVSMNGVPKENGRSRPRLSAKARASLVLQGRYMGYMRQLKPRQKAQVRKMREAKGVRSAIARARELSQS